MDGIKSAIINPLLKKALLDIDEKKNYRPVSNLLFMSKLTERVVLNRLDHHMLVNNFLSINGDSLVKTPPTDKIFPLLNSWIS